MSRNFPSGSDRVPVSRRQLLRTASAAAAGTAALSGLERARAATVSETVEVEMSDGVVIRGDIFYPSDGDGNKADGTFPVVGTFDPYNTGSQSNPALLDIVEDGYIRAQFDVRGTGRSDGRFRQGDDREELDFGELVYWLADHEQSTGKIGLYGTSYLGLTQLLAARGVERVREQRNRDDQPLKALFPNLTGVSGYRDILFNGGMYGAGFATFWLGYNMGLQNSSPLLSADSRSFEETIEMQRARVAGTYESSLSTIVGSHLGTEEAYQDEENARWHAHPSVVDLDIPVFTYQGWNDIFQPSAPLLYTQLQNLWAGRDQFAPMDPDQEVTGRYQCVIGPYLHTSDLGSEPWARRWFDRFLKGVDNGIDDTDTPLHLFQVYGDRWVDVRTWPLPDHGERSVERLFLGSGRTGTAAHTINDGSLEPEPSDAEYYDEDDSHDGVTVSDLEEDHDADTVVTVDESELLESLVGDSLLDDDGVIEEDLGVGPDAQVSDLAGDESDTLLWRAHNPCHRGTSEKVTFGMVPENECMNDNRTFEAGTLAYTTPPFDEGRNIAGPITASLYASTDNTNTSWAVMLSVIKSDGTSRMLSKGQLLGAFRGLDESRSWYALASDASPSNGNLPVDSREPPAHVHNEDEEILIRPYHEFTQANEEPVEPGAIERYDVLMDPIFARIHPGDRLRLSIRTNSSWAFPLAKDIDDVVGTYEIQRTDAYASHLSIPFVEGPLPESDREWGPCPRDCGTSYEE